MTGKIFKNIMVVSVAALVICVICISYVLYGYFGNIIKKELKNETALIESCIDGDESKLENLNISENRITLIDTDGSVIFDSEADAGSMENHIDRSEIEAALKDGEAYAERYSDTLSIKTVYYAKTLADGKIIRIAQEQSMINLLLKGMLLPMVIIIVLAVIFASMLSARLAKKIVKPVNEMNLDDMESDEPYSELAPLVGKIRQQKKRIDMQLDEMKKKQKEFTAITENMNEGFLLIGRNMEVLSYNKAAMEILGDGYLKNPSTAIELNRSKGFRSAVEEGLGGNHNQQRMEKEGRSYSVIANPVTEEGYTIGAVVIVMDITEREQRDRLRREFTSNVSHELKTPLTTIYGVSDMMAEGIVKQSDVSTFSRNIRDESGRMINLIDDIIELSRLDEESLEREFLQVDLFEISKSVISRLSQKADAHNVKLYLEGERALINGVPSMCEEMIYNLCDNAIKYNKDDGSVTISARKYDENVAITVEDTGIGIPFEYRDRIFERFFRIDKSRSQSVDGTGLGLSIVKHAAINMNGTIKVESAEGEGTKLTVTFPCVK